MKLDDKQFGFCLTSEKYKADIDKDTQEGRKVGITGTPGFFINGIEISGAKPQEEFTRVIDEELARKNNNAKSVNISITRVDH